MIRLLIAGMLCLLAVAQTGCSTSDHIVALSPSRSLDLFWRGAFTDHAGYRWDIGIVPGVVPTFRTAREAYEEAWDFTKVLGHGETYERMGHFSMNAFRFAFEDCIGEFLLEGIANDYGTANSEIAGLASNKPFGWVAGIAGQSVWGYVLKPVGRLVLAPIGMAGGVVVAVAAPPVEVVGRPVGSLVWIAAKGTLYPAALLVLNVPAWALTVWNREPDPSMDGKWWLRITERPPVAPPPPMSLDEARKVMQENVQQVLVVERLKRIDAQQERLSKQRMELQRELSHVSADFRRGDGQTQQWTREEMLKEAIELLDAELGKLSAEERTALGDLRAKVRHRLQLYLVPATQPQQQ